MPRQIVIDFDSRLSDARLDDLTWRITEEGFPPGFAGGPMSIWMEKVDGGTSQIRITGIPDHRVRRAIVIIERVLKRHVPGQSVRVSSCAVSTEAGQGAR
jgi:hypothetical protein